MKKLITAATIFALSVASGFGEGSVLSGKVAKKMLFSHKGSEFVVVQQDFMVEADVKILNLMAGMKEFKSVLYYGAVAASPKHGLTHKATAASSNHHTPEAAGRAAVNECNRLRNAGPKCVVVAQIVPKKFSQQQFQLSASATAAFKKTYMRGGGPKAFVISPSTGGYAMSKADSTGEAAMAACGNDGATDCVVVVQD